MQTLEDIDDKADQQLKILYALKIHIDEKDFSILEKSIRMGDKSILDIHKRFDDNKNKDLLILSLKELAHKIHES